MRHRPPMVSPEWECSGAHRWLAALAQVRRGQWCPKCHGNARPQIAEMRSLAATLGGECLSTDYLNSKTKLQWKCHEGHVWEATAQEVKLKRRWCKVCKKSGRIAA